MSNQDIIKHTVFIVKNPIQKRQNLLFIFLLKICDSDLLYAEFKISS